MNTESQVLNVPIEDIIPNRFQPRLNFDESSLQELASSIKEHGIIQPLVLRRLGDKFEIIAGERRYKASKLAGLTTVPAIISNMSDETSAEVAIVENIQRKDLSSIEEAKSYKALLDKGYLTQEELAKKMGLSQSAISNKLRLLSLSENVQKALMEGKISERHARSLLQVSDTDEQDKWLDIIINERLTVRALDKRLKEKMSDQKENMEIDKKEDLFNSSPQMPNKFFNFLEDEQINMSTSEDTEENQTPIEPVIEEVNDTINEVAPARSDATINPVESQPEEIEMLDFLAPTDNLNILSNKKDMTIANNLVDKLINDLQANNYHVDIIKEDNSSEIKYSITIKKED